MGRRIQNEEVEMECALCKGTMIEGKTNLPFETAHENMVVVKGVPALVCSQCGESFIEIQVLRHVEEIVDSAERSGITLGFVQYRKAA